MSDSDTRREELGQVFREWFWNKASITTMDQPDRGDTWHIAKKDFNTFVDRIVEAHNVECLRQLNWLEEVYSAHVDLNPPENTLSLLKIAIEQAKKEYENGR